MTCQEHVPPSNRWVFAESAEDGALWLESPNVLAAYVDYTSEVDGRLRRLMVVTESWLQQHLVALVPGSSATSTALPAMVVLPNLRGSALRTAVDAVVNRGGIDSYATLLGRRE